MKQFFYPASRAHHAYSMAIDFGMKFKKRDGFWTPRALLHVTGAGGYRIEIAQESLNLLEPQVGDFVTNTHCQTNRNHRACSGYVVGFLNRRKDAYVDKGERHNGKDAFCEEVGSLRIIQREGKPFHTPESEEA